MGGEEIGTRHGQLSEGGPDLHRSMHTGSGGRSVWDISVPRVGENVKPPQFGGGVQEHTNIIVRQGARKEGELYQAA